MKVPIKPVLGGGKPQILLEFQLQLC
uniref:Uncharacterized protein n=1 Tax=Anguilla anguilla TaxID=7936 RepID=A0A0E9X982_ANGAN